MPNAEQMQTQSSEGPNPTNVDLAVTGSVGLRITARNASSPAGESTAATSTRSDVATNRRWEDGDHWKPIIAASERSDGREITLVTSSRCSTARIWTPEGRSVATSRPSGLGRQCGDAAAHVSWVLLTHGSVALWGVASTARYYARRNHPDGTELPTMNQDFMLSG